jgi:hypothetical protein
MVVQAAVVQLIQDKPKSENPQNRRFRPAERLTFLDDQEK